MLIQLSLVIINFHIRIITLRESGLKPMVEIKMDLPRLMTNFKKDEESDFKRMVEVNVVHFSPSFF